MKKKDLDELTNIFCSGTPFTMNNKELEELLNGLVRKDGKTLNQLDMEAKQQLQSTLPDDMGLFRKGKRGSYGELEDFTVLDSFDSYMTPALFTSEARTKLAHAKSEVKAPKIIIVKSFDAGGDHTDYYIRLSKKFFSPHLGIKGIDGLQVYSVLSYLLEKDVVEFHVDGLLDEYLSNLEDYHISKGTDVRMPMQLSGIMNMYSS